MREIADWHRDNRTGHNLLKHIIAAFRTFELQHYFHCRLQCFKMEKAQSFLQDAPFLGYVSATYLANCKFRIGGFPCVLIMFIIFFSSTAMFGNRN